MNPDEPNEPENLSDIILKDLPKTGYVRQAELLERLPFSAATLWRKVKARQFPQPIKLSKRVTAWRIEEIRAWLEALHNQTCLPC